MSWASKFRPTLCAIAIVIIVESPRRSNELRKPRRFPRPDKIPEEIVNQPLTRESKLLAVAADSSPDSFRGWFLRDFNREIAANRCVLTTSLPLSSVPVSRKKRRADGILASSLPFARRSSANDHHILAWYPAIYLDAMPREMVIDTTRNLSPPRPRFGLPCLGPAPKTAGRDREKRDDAVESSSISPGLHSPGFAFAIRS